MLTIHRTLNSLGKLAYRDFKQQLSSLSSLSASERCLSHTNVYSIYRGNNYSIFGTDDNNGSLTLSYKNYYFWLKSLEDNYYAYGIKRRFMSEFGNVKYIDIEEDPIKILSVGDYIGNIENDKTVQALEAPFNNCIVIDAKEDICLDTLNNDPENTAHYLCVLEHVSG